MGFTYVLECNNGQYYVGSSHNISNRLSDHKNGRVKFTKNKRPLRLVFLKQFTTYNEAYVFERKIKSWKKRKSIERMLDKADNIYKKYCGIV